MKNPDLDRKEHKTASFKVKKNTPPEKILTHQAVFLCVLFFEVLKRCG